MRKLKLDELNRLSVEEFKNSPKQPIQVILDNIRSLINVGAVFRSADAFRVEKVWLCGYTPAPPHREITKTAIGAEQSVDWEKADNVMEVLEKLKADGWEIVSVEQAEGSMKLNEFRREEGKRYAVVMGNEVEGVQQQVVSASDTVVEIPQFGTKHSLNLAVCTGIVLYQMVLGA